MPLESASYASQLVPSNPASTDLVGQADDHIRLIKNVIKNTFPNVTGPITQTQDRLNQSSPIGLIALWYGNAASCPTGWAVCDGSTVNGYVTPNLVDRFVVGAGTIAAYGLAAGSSTASATTSASGAHSHSVTNVAHTHTATASGTALTTAQLPAHNHNLKVAPITVDAGGSATFTNISTTGGGVSTYVENSGTGATHDHALTVNSATPAASTSDTAATHTHSVSGVSIIPPCAGLHYVMRVA